jgi:hypothetical protein
VLERLGRTPARLRATKDAVGVGCDTGGPKWLVALVSTVVTGAACDRGTRVKGRHHATLTPS